MGGRCGSSDVYNVNSSIARVIFIMGVARCKSCRLYLEEVGQNAVDSPFLALNAILRVIIRR